MEMLQLLEEGSDAVAPLVGDSLWNDDFAGSVGRDGGRRSHFGAEGAQFVAVIGFIGTACVGIVQPYGRRGNSAGPAAVRMKRKGRGNVSVSAW